MSDQLEITQNALIDSERENVKLHELCDLQKKQIAILRAGLEEIATHVNPHPDGLDGRFVETKSTIMACKTLADADLLGVDDEGT